MAFLQLSERFKIDKWIHGIEQYRTEFEMDCVWNNEHVIANYKFLLKFETKEEQVKECSIVG